MWEQGTVDSEDPWERWMMRTLPSCLSGTRVVPLHLLESPSVALTAELDLFARAPEFLSGQLPSGRPLITPLQERCCSLQTPPGRS